MQATSLPAAQGEHNLKNYEQTYETFDWSEAEKQFAWFKTGKVNIAHEAIDRHCETERKNKTALYYIDAHREEQYTFLDLKRLSNKFANVLKKLDIRKGDRVSIFMPRSPEWYVAALGALKIGAILCPIFESFMREAAKDRLADSEARAIVTTPELLSRIPNDELPALERVIVVGETASLDAGQISYDDEMSRASDRFEVEWVDREDGMILQYTSGSTGKPLGALHVHNAMIQLYQAAKWTLDLKDNDIYWCSADPGWLTGTAAGTLGPWLVGATVVARGGKFSAAAWYETIEKYNVSVWYSSPTAFRMLMGAGDELVKKYDLSRLRHIVSVGEPLHPEVIDWGLTVFDKRIHDTWWMTETGAPMICNFPCMEVKPGSMGKPFPGIVATIIDDEGAELPPYQTGNLAIKAGWPAMMRKVWNNDKAYDEYFKFNDWYVSGDSAYRDDDGYFWFQGRVDDVIVTSGERIGPFEIESKLIEHPAVLEAGVIGKPDPKQGEMIKAFITLRDGYVESESLLQEICDYVKKNLALHAAPREIEVIENLPKTRSGKIMRRVLKEWELGKDGT